MLSITRQCRLVSIARSSDYYEGRGESPLNLRLMRLIEEQFLETLSNTLEPSFCVATLEQPLERYGAPEIFNADQGGQFTSLEGAGGQGLDPAPAPVSGGLPAGRGANLPRATLPGVERMVGDGLARTGLPSRLTPGADSRRITAVHP